MATDPLAYKKYWNQFSGSQGNQKEIETYDNMMREYAMIKAAAKMGWIDEDKAILETITSIKRAGADLIATYFAKDVVRLIN